MIIFIRNIMLKNFKRKLEEQRLFVSLNIKRFIFSFLHVTTSKDRCLIKLMIYLDYITNQD